MKRWAFFFLAASVLLGQEVTPRRLLQAQEETGAWLMYGRNYAAWRFSPLQQIDPSNVARLTPQWIFQTGVRGKFQTTPLVFDGLMYITTDSNRAFALDLLTGRPLWQYASEVPKGISGCCGEPNRGFAALGDRLFKVNIEGTLVALDAKTGSVVWETTMADYKKGFSATAAPLVVKDMVISGIAGAEFGTRDFLDAYDASTGKLRWRFWTIPAPGEPGHNTWGSGDAWMRGGGSTWITGSYDPELNLIYWGTGNPGPDLNGEDRPGDNLYTCSVIALDADTGKLVWHYQFTPHDEHDWDAASDLVLVDVEYEGKAVKAVIQANRNGFFYALDRKDGRFLFAKPYTEVDWATGIGTDGRPMLVPNKRPSPEGTIACPGLLGGHTWPASTYSPQTGLYYFNSTDGCHIYFNTRQEYIEGQWYQGSTYNAIPSRPQKGSIIGLHPANGEIAWRFEMVTPSRAGLLSTAGGLVFSADTEGYVFSLDARSGKPLWNFATGAWVQGSPISYEFRGRQYIAIASGQALITFALPK